MPSAPSTRPARRERLMALRTRYPALAYPWDDAIPERRFVFPRPWKMVPGGALGLIALALLGAGLGAAAAFQPVLALAGAAGALVFAWTTAKPVRGAYL